MYQFFESIQLKDSVLKHLDLHVQRMQRTCLFFYQEEKNMDALLQELDVLQTYPSGLYKVKIKYNVHAHEIEITPYVPRVIETLQVIINNDIQYPWKTINRQVFFAYEVQRKATEDFLFVREDCLTDSSYSNIALWNGKEWHTPEIPLFNGIQREVLIQEGRIIANKITLSDMRNYQKISLINAMLPLGEIEIPIANIFFP